ncbi:MAG: hypothetical protein ACO295_00455 [Sediminibacterium sp.]
MITNDGKQLIAKFLLDQAPSFATHIAAGSGARPILSSASASISADIESLDFEVFRVPIIAKGFVKENGQEKIVLKAEMPTDQRYLISEVGVFPAEVNSLADRYDSKLLLSFTTNESWNYNQTISGSPQLINSEAITFNNTELDTGNSDNNIDESFPDFAFIASDQKIFANLSRSARYEPPRFLNRSLLYRGNLSGISASTFDISASSSYLENSNISINLGKNLPDDEIKIAFSVLSKTAASDVNPDFVRIVLQFMNDVSGNPSATANFEFSDADMTYSESESNRYLVGTKKISDFNTSETFSWSNINKIRIYAFADAPDPSDFYFIFDGIRLENLSTDNPLYTMVGYTVVKTDNALPVVKKENTNNFIEYRFGIGVS